MLSHCDYTRIAVECKIAMQLRRGLPARDERFAKEDVADAVAVCKPAIELIEDHAGDPCRLAHGRAVVANNASNDSCALGRAVAHWRALDFTAIIGTMVVNDVEIDRGCGGNVMSGYLL